MLQITKVLHLTRANIVSLHKPQVKEDSKTTSTRPELSDSDFVRAFRSFNRTGFWRANLESGHVFFCEQACSIFGLKPTDKPINLIAAFSRIHPDDLMRVVEVHEASSVHPMAYQKIFRIRIDGEGYRWFGFICATHKGRAESGEITGMIYLLPEQRSQFDYILAEPSE
ncbi:PAS domain-containing protein [Rhizobium sp. SSA_523]|uniref:PAS domain-containing protein n=1 Tax=Rhizobium sp. SSA_523 TaxID=2952477 RepID=UPI0020906132|nr:PAS domain-containing protein [Rhizobium sp. SSA_523]MCO5730473.1 PAS domain-containing protein [Rhizobium sp. SSA_523]WKC25513.1 PAS domain-containing protein [Rhizobium sp. SSA_523]